MSMLYVCVNMRECRAWYDRICVLMCVCVNMYVYVHECGCVCVKRM